jgi:hypothetical protein
MRPHGSCDVNGAIALVRNTPLVVSYRNDFKAPSRRIHPEANTAIVCPLSSLGNDVHGRDDDASEPARVAHRNPEKEGRTDGTKLAAVLNVRETYALSNGIGY